MDRNHIRRYYVLKPTIFPELKLDLCIWTYIRLKDFKKLGSLIFNVKTVEYWVFCQNLLNYSLISKITDRKKFWQT